MTRLYAMRRLLEHGALTLGEAATITRWPRRATQVALVNLQEKGEVRSRIVRGRWGRVAVYSLTDTARARAHFAQEER